MTGLEIDYAVVFDAVPSPVLLLTPDWIIAAANQAYLQAAGRTREDLIGKYVFDAFPDNPSDPTADGVSNVTASLRRVLDTGERDTMALQKYDVEILGRPGEFEERYWSPLNAPVLDADGQVMLIINRVEEVTDLICRGSALDDSRRQAMEAELYSRARELQQINDQLRQAHAQQREVALALQDAMLPAPAPIKRRDAAVLYRPAASALTVCGDWYDLVELPADRIAVAVGDVVGHGLSAACVMGQLRSALSAAVRVAEGPAQALDALGLYSRSVDGAEATTAVLAVIDCAERTITYSCAGHPPPVLLHTDNTVEFLDQATDPPLGSRFEHLPRPQAVLGFDDGATLVLYTDGLIERRGEDIDVGLARLADALVRHGHREPEELASALMADLCTGGAATDDTALVVMRL